MFTWSGDSYCFKQSIYPLYTHRTNQGVGNRGWIASNHWEGTGEECFMHHIPKSTLQSLTRRRSVYGDNLRSFVSVAGHQYSWSCSTARWRQFLQGGQRRRYNQGFLRRTKHWISITSLSPKTSWFLFKMFFIIT
jgi:hypothetical protein